jgi:VWFA-related protein
LANQPNYRQVILAVQARNKHPMPELTAKDLRLYQGNKQLQIAFFQPQPAAVGIVVDTSGSMDRKLTLCRTAIKAFIDNLNDSDEISLFAFSDHPFLLQAWTTNHSVVIQRLAILHAYGRTAIYDSLSDMLIYISKSSAKRGAILLITDGLDDSSSSSLAQTEELARKMNVAIYSIGIGNPNIYSSSFLGSMTHDMEALDTKALNTLATDTGGETFVVTLDDKGTALNQAIRTIASKLGNQYIVGFIGDGSTNNLRVEVVRDKGLVFKVKSAS